ncbi:MAG: hypothetical protein HYU84_03855 [Chloroflexi bacterium]|nr:hypothetical protein [Chloroflexota bacterium]
MFRKWFTFPAVRIGVVTVFVFEILMAFPSVRAAAKDFLTLFRVQQVVVLPLDSIGLEGAGGNDSFGSQLSMLISDSTIVTDEPEAPIPFTDIESASAAASFDIRLPGGMTPTSILVFDSAAFNMEVSRAKAQALVLDLPVGTGYRARLRCKYGKRLFQLHTFLANSQPNCRCVRRSGYELADANWPAIWRHDA